MQPTITAATPFGENPHFGDNGEVICDISLEGDEQLDDDVTGNAKVEDKAIPKRNHGPRTKYTGLQKDMLKDTMS
eukprot:7765939-Ditylum_brightwellii.AAC.1